MDPFAEESRMSAPSIVDDRVLIEFLDALVFIVSGLLAVVVGCSNHGGSTLSELDFCLFKVAYVKPELPLDVVVRHEIDVRGFDCGFLWVQEHL